MSDKPKPIMSREEVLALLSEQARAGSISAAIALERALRLHGGDDDDHFDDELDQILRGEGR